MWLIGTRVANVIQERQQPYYRELQCAVQHAMCQSCPQHGSPVTCRGCLFNDHATARLLSNFPFARDFYHDAIVQTSFPNADQCHWGEDVSRASGQAPAEEKGVEGKQDSKIGNDHGYQFVIASLSAQRVLQSLSLNPDTLCKTLS